MDRVLDLERTTRVIEAVDPDILVLNEMDHGTDRSFGVRQADSLGRLLNMYAVFGRSIDYDGGEYGNALLSKYPILDFRIVDLSTDTTLEGRSVFLATLDLQTDTLMVMGTHLGLDQNEQEDQIARIITVLPVTTKLILAGDFNFEPDAKTYQDICKYFEDGILTVAENTEHTYPADKPDRRIDYIFVGTAIEAVSAPAIESTELSTASDHRPQVLEFMIR